MSRIALPGCRSVLATLLSIGLSSSAAANGFGNGSFEWNVFGSFGLGMIDSTSEFDDGALPYNGYDEDLKPDDVSRIGLQTQVPLSDHWHFTLQAISDGEEGFQPNLEWAYFSRELSPSLRIRAGYLRTPLYRYAEDMNVGFTQDWINPPALPYLNIEPFCSSVQAVDLIYRGQQGSLDYFTEFYVGIGGSEGIGYGNGEVVFRTDFNTGVKFGLDLNDFNLWMGLTYADVGLVNEDFELLRSTLNDLGYERLSEVVDVRSNNMYFYSLAFEQTAGDWKFGGEIVHAPNQSLTLPDSVGSYLMINRTIRDMTVGYTFSSLQGKPSTRTLDELDANAEAATEAGESGRAAILRAMAEGMAPFVESTHYQRTAHQLGMRWGFAPHVGLKFQYEHMIDHRSNESYNSGAVVLDFAF